jgi:thioredoxin-related protein
MVQVKRIFLLLIILVNLGIVFGVSYNEYVLFNRFDEAFLSAKILRKGVILIISQPQCVFSAFLRQVVFSDQQVSDFLRNHYIVVEIYPDTEETGHFYFGSNDTYFSMDGKTYTYEDLYNIFLLRGTPTNVFFSKELKLISTFTGSVPPPEYLQISKYLSQNLFFEGISWDEYKKRDDTYAGTPEILYVSEIQKEYLVSNTKNIRVVTLEEIKTEPADNLDPSVYYLIENATKEEISGVLEERGLTLYNLYIVINDNY